MNKSKKARMMACLFLFILLLILPSTFLISCFAPQKSGSQPVLSSGEAESVPAAKPALSQSGLKWENILKDGSKEGRVVIHTSVGGQLRQDIANAFNSRYKNIELEFVMGRGTEKLARILAERRAGLYLGDLLIGGASTPIISFKPQGILTSLEPFLILPEVLDSGAWHGGGIPFIDKEKTTFAFMARPQPSIALNAGFVKESEIRSYKDLLNPKWKGKIVLDDPTIDGPGLRWFAVVGGKILDMDYMKQFAKQEPFITRDFRLGAEWLAQGKYFIGLGLLSAGLAEFQSAGVPLVEKIAEEGTYITSGAGTLGILDGAPHKNAATIFINWLLSREGQLAWSRSELRQSARTDIPIDHLDKRFIRQPGANYIIGDSEELLLSLPKYAEIAKEVFAPSLKK